MRSLRATRDRREDGDLILGPHRGIAGGGFAVAPNPTVGHNLGEGRAVSIDRGDEHLVDGRAVDRVPSGTGGFTRRSEETKRRHGRRLRVHRHNYVSGVGYGHAVTRLLLVRHGQSEWNAVGRWQGKADPALTEFGRQQAFHAAQRIGTVDVIVASPLIRAFETAQIISAQIGVGPIVVDPDLMERDAGEWEGLTRTEIEARWPGYLGHDKWPPGYELHDQLLLRTRAALDRIHAEYEGADVLVLTHGGVIGTLEVQHSEQWQRMPNLGGRVFLHRGDRLEIGERVVLVEDDEITIPDQI